MKSSSKKVLLLFGGGASLLDRSGKASEVQNAKDVHAWLRSIPELSLIASVKPMFLYSETSFDAYPKWWKTIAQTITERFKDYDGFIVTQDVDAIPYTAAALSLMLRDIGKPVIITGSSLQSHKSSKAGGSANELAEIGIRANLVNAVQVATLDIGEVAVLFGNRLIRGGNIIRHTTSSLNIFESAGDSVLGRVDFGLKIESNRKKRTNTPPMLSTNLKTRILQMTMIPSAVFPALPDLSAQKIDGIFITGHASFSSEALSRITSLAEKHKIPVGVFVESPIGYSKHFLVVSNMTPIMALTKFMWVLGQGASLFEMQKLLETDIAGELITPNTRRR